MKLTPPCSISLEPRGEKRSSAGQAPPSLVFVGALAALIGLAVVPARAAEVSCLGCHEEQQKLFVASAHAQAGLSCPDCHGGDPRVASESAHNVPGFKRPDTKQEIAESCARCHSDVRRMNPYGLPTDQLERYKTSKHGEQLFGHGDQKVATCTDCHGVHDILKVRAPQSRTHPTHIPQTCGRCHSDAKLMSQYQLPADVVAKYLTSYHAQLLLEKGDLSAPTCITCHGNHGAVPPGAKEVGQVCGKCHGRQRELFEQSPHAQAATTGTFSECVSCHGHHAIQKATADLFAQSCIRCHAQEPKSLARRDVIATLIHNVQGAYEHATARVKEATLLGLATEDQQVLLQEAKTQLTQLEALQHTLLPEQMQPVATRAEGIVKAVIAGIDGQERNEQWKHWALAGCWGFMLAMAVIFWLKRRELGQKEKP